VSTLTTNYNLIKPDYADSTDIADINGNSDILDNVIKAISDKANANETAIATKQNSTDNTLTTTDKTIPGAINEVNARGLSAYSIMTDTTLSSTETTYNTYSSRKFSDYTLIIFKMGSSSSDVRRTVVVPTSLWNSGKTINESVIHGATTSSASSYSVTPITIKYNNDTSIKASVSGAGAINHLEIIGIKFG
jgi:hypothetical protein